MTQGPKDEALEFIRALLGSDTADDDPREPPDVDQPQPTTTDQTLPLLVRSLFHTDQETP